ncbi:MAG: hypothetical protein IT211_05885 [Armatimonadetes bacterium]|nr:hypothetical protein [Armatimonadota bacterium]
MNDFEQNSNDQPPSQSVERLVTKGKSVLDLCIERNKLLCVKGFIDCQIERGGDYVRVVEQMVGYIDTELQTATDRHRRKLLTELQGYAAQQLQSSPEIPV